MRTVACDDRGFVVSADILADAFGLTQAEVKTAMRGGSLTSRCEAGVEEDAGKWRLTFHFQGRASRLIVDDAGKIVQRASFPIRTNVTPGSRAPEAGGAER